MDYTERRIRATEALLNWDATTRAELAKLRAQRDALAEALRTAMAILSEHAEDDAFLRFQIGNMDLDAKARTALATLEAGKGPQ